MTQATADQRSIPTSNSGMGAIVSDVQAMFDALFSLNSGAGRPANPVAGMMWLDTSATPWAVKLWTGQVDVTLFQITPSSSELVLRDAILSQAADPTKRVKFDTSLITADQTRSIKVPDRDVSLDMPREKLSETIVSTAVPAVSFSGLNTRGFTSYDIEFEDVRGTASNAGLVMRAYDPALISTAAYSRLVIYSGQTLGVPGSAAPSGGQDTGTSLPLTASIGSGSTVGTGSGTLKLMSIASTAPKAFKYSSIALSDANVQFGSWGQGFISTNSVLTAVDLYMSSGNIVAGKFTLFGAKR